MTLPTNINDREQQKFVEVGSLPAVRVALVSGSSSSEESVITTGGLVRAVASSIVRPSDTTAYASGDLVANSTTSGSVTPFSFSTAARVTAGSLIVRKIRLRKTSTGITNAQFRVHLFSASPTVSVGDNAAFNSAGALSTTGSANYLGQTDITLDSGFSDGANGFSGSSFYDTHIKLASGTTVYALLEARAAYTPTSGETITMTLEVMQD